MNFVLKSTILLICLANFIHCDEDKVDEIKAIFQYKSNVTLECSEKENVAYFQVKDGNETQLTESEHVKITESGLVLSDLRAEQIRESTYYCKSNDKKVSVFTKLVAPYILKPEKPSQTVTEGGIVELKCGLLYGENTQWVWTKNGTEIIPDEKFIVVKNESFTSLKIIGVKNEDKGEYQCELRNSHGAHAEIIQVRVKDALAALWPFLAIVAEVIILCLIILIYEKKCSKKPNNNEEENEQAQNLMGKDGSELKKRTTKA